MIKIVAAAVLATAFLGIASAMADDCVTGDEMQAYLKKTIPQISKPIAMPKELVKAFLEVTHFPAPEKSSKIEVLRNEGNGMVMVVPENADGCAFASPLATSLASQPKDATSLVVPGAIFQRFMQQSVEKVNGKGA